MLILHALRKAGSASSAQKVLPRHPLETRGITCIFMPLSQDIVIDRCSAALTPAGPPICITHIEHLTPPYTTSH